VLGALRLVEQAFDGQQLQPRVFLSIRAFVKTCGGGFGLHRLGWRGECEKQTDVRLVARQRCDQVLHHRRADILAAFIRDSRAETRASVTEGSRDHYAALRYCWNSVPRFHCPIETNLFAGIGQRVLGRDRASRPQ